MAVDRRQGARDSAEKIELERQLRPKLRQVGEEAARAVSSAVRAGRSADGVGRSVAGALEPVLRDHYLAVSLSFSGRLGDQMPPDVAIREDERREISRRLAALFRKRAEIQAGFIGDTTDADVVFALRIAELERDRLREMQTVSAAEFAAIVGAVFDRKFRGRESARVTFETQVPAELTKQVEGEVLSGFETEGELGIEPKARRPKPNKEWVSQGDDVVRPWHLDADSDQVPIDQPYTVMGEKLMFPGDASLGASKPNLLGCRCSSVVDPAPVVVSRRSLLAAGAFAAGLFGNELPSQ